MIHGSSGDLSYFLSGSYLRNDLGIENPTADAQRDPRPHDASIRPFAYVSDILSDTSRISLFGGSFIGHFQIPNVTGARRRASPSTACRASIPPSSTRTSARSRIMASPPINMPATRSTSRSRRSSAIRRPGSRPIRTAATSSSTASPTPRGCTSLAAGVQADGSYQLSEAHTLRFGLFFQNEHTTLERRLDGAPVE